MYIYRELEVDSLDKVLREGGFFFVPLNIQVILKLLKRYASATLVRMQKHDITGIR